MEHVGVALAAAAVFIGLTAALAYTTWRTSTRSWPPDGALVSEFHRLPWTEQERLKALVHQGARIQNPNDARLAEQYM